MIVRRTKLFFKFLKSFLYFKNPLTVIKFYCGVYPKNQKVKIIPKNGPEFYISRYTDTWLTDSIFDGHSFVVDNQKNIINYDKYFLREGTSDTFIYREIFLDGLISSEIHRRKPHVYLE